ncbi:MAG: type VI secretion system tip protein TssI/VgrG [Polyangiales bacterium]
MTTLGSLRFSFMLDGHDAPWELVEATLDESLHALPAYAFEVLCEPEDAAAVRLHQELRFELGREDNGQPVGDALVRVGVIVATEHVSAPPGRRARLRVTASSKAWALALGRRNRIFQKSKASDAVRATLSAAGLDATVADASAVREMCTQFSESDLDFVRRLCEEEGHTLVIDHATSSGVSTVNAAQADVFPALPAVEFSHVTEVESLGEPGVYALAREARATVIAASAADWDLARGQAVLGTRSMSPSALAEGTGSQTLEAVGAARGYAPNAGLASKIAGFEVDALAGAHDLLRGESNLQSLRAGVRLTLNGHPTETEPLLVTRVMHRVRLRETVEGGYGGDAVYENEFECVPTSRAYRPPRATPRPVALAPQSATVIEFPTREAGRGYGEVRVRFPWAAPDHAATAWVRVAQLLAGNGWGAQLLPRVGMEVVVQFLDGDPDRPVVTGSVYNGTRALPAALPNLHTRSTIRTRSWGDASPDNELFFEDADGAEVLGMVACRDHDVKVTNDELRAIGRNRTETIEGNAELTVKKNETRTVHENRTTTVKGIDKVTVEKNQELTIKQSQKVTAFQKVTISADEGIVFQCGDTKIDISPTGVTITNSAALKIAMTASALTLEHPSAGKVELSGPGVTVQSTGGAKVELVASAANIAGTPINLN